MKSGVINSSEPRTRQESGSQLTGVTVSAVKWITNEATGFDELVRESDGQVLDRRRTRKERKQMRAKAEARVRSAIGTKPEGSHLTIESAAGQHASSGTALVNVRCDCGKEVREVILSEITTGRRKYCDKRTCPLAEADHRNNSLPNLLSAVGKRRSGVKKPKRNSDNGQQLGAVAPRDFAGISSVVEAIATIAEKVSVEDAEALVEELRRMEASQPLFQPRGVHLAIPTYRRLAEAFVGFRRGIEA